MSWHAAEYRPRSRHLVSPPSPPRNAGQGTPLPGTEHLVAGTSRSCRFLSFAHAQVSGTFHACLIQKPVSVRILPNFLGEKLSGMLMGSPFEQGNRLFLC